MGCLPIQEEQECEVVPLVVVPVAASVLGGVIQQTSSDYVVVVAGERWMDEWRMIDDDIDDDGDDSGVR